MSFRCTKLVNIMAAPASKAEKSFDSLDDLGKFSLEKKKSVNFHTLGPDPPPPLKSVKLNKIFFSHTLTETYFGKRNLFFHL